MSEEQALRWGARDPDSRPRGCACGEMPGFCPGADEFADRARRAQKAFRDRRAALEAEGVEIWSAETPNVELTAPAEAERNRHE